MICLYLRSGFRLSTDLTLARMYVYRLALETVERRKNEKLYNFEHLEHHKPVQLGVTATDYCVLGRLDEPKDHSKNIDYGLLHSRQA